MTTSGGDAPVTVVVTRVVRPGREDAFAAWADDIDAAAASFAGYLTGIRLHDETGLNHLIQQFESPDHLRAWEQSRTRRDLLRRGDQLSSERRVVVGGRDTWFRVPGRSTPPKWKTFLITWAAVYPILLIIATTQAAVVPQLPQPAGLAVSSGTLTAVLTWIILPRLNHRARPWLLHGAHPTPIQRLSQSRTAGSNRRRRSRRDP
jgi:antibiotic biosynthesis monooxygenase (ABM) superfamily enzyme